MLGRYFHHLYAESEKLNRQNILDFVAEGEASGQLRLLDLGCDDGAWTNRLAGAVNAKSFGIEIVVPQASKALAEGVSVCRSDLNAELPFRSGSFDVIHSNQVIEHVSNVDRFVSEIFRLLKSGGSAVVSTENGSSWHNVFASILGWQIFSSTNISEYRGGLGNPFSLTRGKDPYLGSWTHKTILYYRGLIELFEAHGFRDVRINGAGYHPLSPRLGRLDVRHSAFITVRAVKPA